MRPKIPMYDYAKYGPSRTRRHSGRSFRFQLTNDMTLTEIKKSLASISNKYKNIQVHLMDVVAFMLMVLE